jgi:hypothetical protein
MGSSKLIYAKGISLSKEFCDAYNYKEEISAPEDFNYP